MGFSSELLARQSVINFHGKNADKLVSPKKAPFVSFPAKTNRFVSPNETNGFATRVTTQQFADSGSTQSQRALHPEPMKGDDAACLSGLGRRRVRRAHDKAVSARHCFHQ